MAKRRSWRVQLSGQAARDFSKILSWTEDNFGARQAHAYDALMRSTLRRLASDPLGGASKARDEDVGAGFRTLHVARPGRHLILYRVEEELVLVVGILHDSMDVSRHLPGAE